MNESYTHTESETDGTESTTSVTYGYVLADGNEGDYISVDVRKPKEPTVPIFITRGGQTSCPYEDGEFTKYYKPGTPLSEATMKREVPLIDCETPIQNNVPSDAAAIFNVQLKNQSETDEDQWLVLSIDETSNQDGALIEMDGSLIYNGRMIQLPANEAFNKIITVKMVQPDVYQYENLGLILHSACQQESIADTVKISAHFQAVCSEVMLNNPDNQWVVNTTSDTTINVGIADYDLAHGSFDKILMRYKSTSTPNWTVDMTFYVNQTDYDNANQPKTWINGNANLEYVFDMKDLQDRNYELKLTTTCVDGTENNSETATGIKDIKRPLIFGSPQPADGILTPNDEVMLPFDEEVYPGNLTYDNFSVRGVLNGNALKHESCLFFDGVSDYASVVRGVNLENKSKIPSTSEFLANGKMYIGTELTTKN